MLAGDEALDLGSHWGFDETVIHLNHGSFGACPRVVLEHQHELVLRMERNSMQLFLRDLEPLLDEARASIGAFVNASPDDLVFVPNATTGVNAILRSLDWSPGDELLVTDHAYNACRNALDYVAARAGAKVVVARVPFPIASSADVTSAIVEAASPRTKLALIDHVTSQTALIFPIADIVKALAEKGIDTLVDGAHAPGMIDLDVTSIGAAYYTGNCHKWVCSPKGSAFLHVRRDKQRGIRPVSISHGANADRASRSRLKLEFDWVGTQDFSPYLSIAKALSFLESLWPGGHRALRERNRALALRSRELLSAQIGAAPSAPPEMIGSIASIPLPGQTHELTHDGLDALHEKLAKTQRIEVPVFPWNGKRLLRVSAFAYNSWAHVQRLSEALAQELVLTP